MSTTDIRVEFEEAIKRTYPLASLARNTETGNYRSSVTSEMWWAWQAATEAAKATGTAGELSDEEILKIQEKHIPKHGWSTNGLSFARDVLAAARQPAPVELSYLQLLAIADYSEAHEALQGFSEDPTQDNGVCVVRAILKAATNRSQP